MDVDLTKQGRGVRWMRTMQQVQEMESSATSATAGKRSAAATAMAKAVLRQSQADEAKREKRIPSGQRLEGDEVFDVDEPRDQSNQAQLSVSPITMYNSEGKSRGRIIAVNEKYICYGLKGGPIRVLNPKTGVKTLLRGHAAPVSDMAFFSQKMDVLGSVSNDGKLFVRRLKEKDEGEDAVDIEDEVLMSLQVHLSREHGDPLFCWHPSLPDGFACAFGNQVFICSISSCIVGNGKSRDIVCNLDQSPPKGVAVLPTMEEEVSAVKFSPKGLLLAIGSIDGQLFVWSMPGAGSDSTSTKLLSNFEPYGKEAIGSIHWLQTSTDKPVLMTGNSSNSDIRLWRLEGERYTCPQTLKFVSSRHGVHAFSNVVDVVEDANLVILANSKTNTLYTVHYGEGKGLELCLDYLSEHIIAQPILSFVAHTADAGASNGNNKMVNVFAVQPKAIQQYFINTEICVPPEENTTEGMSEVESAVEEKPAQRTHRSPRGEKAFESPTETGNKQQPRLLTPSQIMQLAGSAGKNSQRRQSGQGYEESANEDLPAKQEDHNISQGSTSDGLSESGPGTHAEAEDAPKVRLLVRPTNSEAPSPDARIKQLEEEVQKLKTDTTAAVAKEGRRLEASLIKAIKANSQESQGMEKKRMEKLVLAMSQTILQDLPRQLADTVKAEMAALEEKIADSIAASVTSSLEASTAKTIQNRLPGAIKGTLTEALRSNFQASVIPSFEAAVREMFAQIDASLTAGLQQQINSTSEVAKVSDLLEQASQLTETLRVEITEGQRKLLAIAADERSRALKQQSGLQSHTGDGSGMMGTSLEQLEAKLDPTIELKGLVEARKYEEAYNKVLSLGDVETVVWLCKQVDATAIFNFTPPLLSQGVLLSLMQQLSTDLQKDTTLKLSWIQNTALALDPQDPVLSVHMRPILQSTFVALNNRLRTARSGEAGQIKLVIHLMNSLLTACK
uniref:Enhancer of mRNA-decapping protein 4 WD40 repeat region domain-containing protein n=1 Tax=Picocystis salinarum TaxID=88271 RepID=A0A7S3UBK8_9CHLO